jgi:SNF2 family DNA or RNA helicase
MLDLIELAIKTRGFGYERLDGQTSLKSRGERIKRFNEESQCTVMLATIGSTGEGFVIMRIEAHNL